MENIEDKLEEEDEDDLVMEKKNRVVKPKIFSADSDHQVNEGVDELGGLNYSIKTLAGTL